MSWSWLQWHEERKSRGGASAFSGKRQDMRIIAGKIKSRSIAMPKGIRPTSGKVRQALFEILKGRIEGANILDLYCGSGAIGIEAFSRGAGGITFVDSSAHCIKILKKTLVQLGILESLTLPSPQRGEGKGEGVTIYKMDAIKALGVFEESARLFDLIFLDPPYYKDMAKNTLIAISNYDILTRNAIIIAEIYKKECLPEQVGGLKKFRTSQYGDTKLEFYKR